MENSHVYLDVCSRSAALGSRSGVLRPLIDSYVADLASRGYEAATIHHLEHSARHFCYWLNHSGIAVSQADDHVMKRFAYKFKAPDKLLAMFKEAVKGG